MPEQIVFWKKNMVKSSFLVYMGCGRGIYAKYTLLRKLWLVYFFKSDEIKEKLKSSNRAFLKIARLDYFGFFNNLHFFNPFWKNKQGIFFQHCRFLHITQWILFLVECIIFFLSHSWKIFNHMLIFFRTICTCIQIKYLADPGKARGWFTNIFVIREVTH